MLDCWVALKTKVAHQEVRQKDKRVGEVIENLDRECLLPRLLKLENSFSFLFKLLLFWVFCHTQLKRILRVTGQVQAPEWPKLPGKFQQHFYLLVSTICALNALRTLRMLTILFLACALLHLTCRCGFCHVDETGKCGTSLCDAIYLVYIV